MQRNRKVGEPGREPERLEAVHYCHGTQHNMALHSQRIWQMAQRMESAFSASQPLRSIRGFLPVVADGMQAQTEQLVQLSTARKRAPSLGPGGGQRGRSPGVRPIREAVSRPKSTSRPISTAPIRPRIPP